MSSARATQLIEAGLWLRLTGDIEGARALFEKALSVDPGNARATQLLGDERIGAGPVVRPKPPATGAASAPPPSTMIFGGGRPPEPPRPTPVPAAPGKSSMLFGGAPASPSLSRPTPIPSGQTLLYPGFAQPPPVERPTSVPPLPAAPRAQGSMSGRPTPPPVAPGRAPSAGALGGHPTPPPIAPVSMPGRAPSTGALGGHPTPPPVAPVSRSGGAPLSGGSGNSSPATPGHSSSAMTSTGRATPLPSIPIRPSPGAGASDLSGGRSTPTPPPVDARRPTRSAPVDLLSAWDEAVPGDAAPSIELSSARTGPDALDLLASAAPAPPATASQPSSKKELIARETEALLAGVKDLIELDDHTGALDLLEKATELSPNHPDLVRLRERSEQILISRYESKLGNLAVAPRVVLSQDEVIWLNLDHRAGFVLAQIDGTVSFEDLFAVCGMSRIDTARILAQLVDEGVIAAAGSAPRGHR